MPPDVRVRAQREPRSAAARRRVHHVRRRISRRRIRTAGYYAGLIRARRGASPEAVAAAVDAVGRVVDARDFNSRGLKLYPVGLKADVVAGVRPALLVLGAAGRVLVLVLMVNLASVLLARAAQREHEFAVSRALGANSAAVVRATLLEGALLGLGGGASARWSAIWGTRALVALAPLDLPRREAIAVDWRIGGGRDRRSACCSACSPRRRRRSGRRAPRCRRCSRAAPCAAAAATAACGAAWSSRRWRCRWCCSAAAGSWSAASSACSARIPASEPKACSRSACRCPRSSSRKRPSCVAFQDRVERALAAIPGVTGVSATSALPLTASASQTTIRIPGAPGNTGNAERDAPLVDFIGTRAAYVEVMGMRVVAGRAFDPVRRDGRAGSADRSPSRGAVLPDGAARSARRFRAAIKTIRSTDRRRRRAGAALRRPPGRPAAALHPRRGLGLPARCRSSCGPSAIRDALVPEVRAARPAASTRGSRSATCGRWTRSSATRSASSAPARC